MAQNAYHADTSFHDWPRRPTLSMAAMLYFLACAGQVLLWLAARALLLAFPGLSGQGLSWAISVAFQLGFLLLPVICYSRGRPGMLRGMRLKRCPPLPLFLCAMAAVAAVFLADSLGTLWLLLLEALGARPSPAAGLMDSGVPVVVMRMLVSALLPAICEELLFRGAILSAWERRGEGRALLASALMFASLHGSLQALPVHLVMGLVLGALVMGSDSLYAGMLFHLIYNGLNLALSMGANPTGQRVLAQLGGAGGVWMTVGRLALFAGLLYALIWALWACCADERRRCPSTRQPVEPSSIVILSGGVVTALCLYLIDLLTLWGVL